MIDEMTVEGVTLKVTILLAVQLQTLPNQRKLKAIGIRKK